MAAAFFGTLFKRAELRLLNVAVLAEMFWGPVSAAESQHDGLVDEADL